MTEVNRAPAFGHAGDSRWSEMLVSYVRAIEYWPYERRGVLRLPDGRRARMAGAIELFKRLDPEVEAIEVVSGETLANIYRFEDGRWDAYR